MKKITVLSCPFCKEELEVVGKGHYFAHKINGCILQHLCFEIDDDEAVKRWNIRKPMERILERLEECKETHDRRLLSKKETASFKIKELQFSGCYQNAIEIVKEEGGINA